MAPPSERRTSQPYSETGIELDSPVLHASVSSTTPRPLLYQATWWPSIYHVHTEGGGGQAQVDACGRGEGAPSPCGRPQKIKIRVILTSYCLLLMQRSWRL